MGRRVAVFAMSTAQKFNALKQVVEDLVKAGAEVRFWTDAVFREPVEAMGASFADLFDAVALADVDDASRPVPSRYVTFAAARAGAVATAAGEWGAELVIYDSFTVLGEAVGRRLGVPWVPVFSLHLVDSATLRREVAADPRVMTDPRCAAAVATLQRDFDMPEAMRFSYFADPSPWLNVVCEPEEWIDAPELRRYQPLACFGKLPAAAFARQPPARAADRRPRIYAAFGTVIWWYWSSQAAAALEVIATAARSIGAELVIGLGGGTLPEATRQRLVDGGAIVHDFANQMEELSRADVFITHHGSSSSHEAIAAMVPMLSFPFSGDQPFVAKRCQALGLALPLIEGRAREEALEAGRVRAAIKQVLAQRTEMRAALARARDWEVEALARRPAIARRILELGGPAGS